MSDLHSLYKDLLSKMSKETWNCNLSLSGFAAQIGSKYNKELMVVGRAVNGWRDIGHPFNWAKGEYLPDVQDIFANKSGCPLAWVAENWGVNQAGVYNTRRSAFWRVIRQVVGVLSGESDDRCSHIIWTNLYKISPVDGGNPTGRLLSNQHDDCKKILRAEIEMYQPKRVLFLTGWEWAEDFLSDLEFDSDGNQTTGTIFNGATVVVMAHPQGKPEKCLVDAILNNFNILSQ